ncbi:MAG: shikimate kinase [Thermodesulfobacteriota bacterium]
MKGNIVLLGFMGVGKGRTARMLAEKSGRFAVDCDDLIESFANMKVREIFKKEGEAHFRELERRVAKWLKKNVRNTIVSTGGGFLQVPNLKKVGTIIYLHADIEQILAGIQAHPNARKKIKKRPLLRDLDKARGLFNQRLPLYRDVADHEIEVGGRSIDSVVEEIMQKI